MEKCIILKNGSNHQKKRVKKERIPVMKKFFNEFKKFISRGNVMDMAVGIISCNKMPELYINARYGKCK